MTAETGATAFGPDFDFTLAGWKKAPLKGGAARALVDEFEQRADQKSELNVFITRSSERARAQAERSDEIIRKGARRPLEGAPIAVKDNFCTSDIRTTAGSKILANFVPNYESTVTQRALDAGAVVLGKTNMDQFGMGSSTETSAFGATLNPLAFDMGRKDVSPGGSSGGSAAAVAANVCLAALGTDTGGSIRQPASFCGVVGFKPTYGVCSRWGVIAYASSLDQAGVITKTVEDAATLMSVIAGPDEKDSTSIPNLAIDFLSALSKDFAGARVAIPKSLREQADGDLEGLWKEIEARLKRIGASVSYIDLPTLRASLAAYYIIALCEASSNLARYDGVKYGLRASGAQNIIGLYEKTRSEGFGAEVQRRILLGTFALSAGYYDQYYLRAARVRAKFCAEVEAAFRAADFMVWPSAPSAAFKLGAHALDPVAMYLEDAFTVPVNLAGLPAISIPGVVTANGMPIGFQVIGPRRSDAEVLGIAKSLESAAAR